MGVWVLILKDGSLRSVISVGSINFALKSVEEQIAITSGFQDFLNALDFPVQILVSSRKLNMDIYLKSLDTLSEKLDNELLKIQAIEYARFIKGLTELGDIMSKNFYVTIPFYVIESSAAGKKSVLENIKSIFKPSEFVKSMDDKAFMSYKTQLDQRIDLIMGGLTSMGLGTTLMKGEELNQLFYSFYNPDTKAR